MPNWVITPDELKKGDLANVGWHPAEIIDYTEGAAGPDAKTPGSTTCTFHFRIIDGANKGVEPRRLFSETAWGFAKTFFSVMKYPKDAAGNYTVSSDMFKQSIGEKLMIHISRGKSNKGNEFNDVDDFRPLT